MNFLYSPVTCRPPLGQMSWNPARGVFTWRNSAIEVGVNFGKITCFSAVSNVFRTSNLSSAPTCPQILTSETPVGNNITSFANECRNWSWKLFIQLYIYEIATFIMKRNWWHMNLRACCLSLHSFMEMYSQWKRITWSIQDDTRFGNQLSSRFLTKRFFNLNVFLSASGNDDQQKQSLLILIILGPKTSYVSAL